MNLAARLAALEARRPAGSELPWLRRIVGRETRADVLARNGFAPDARVNWIERHIIGAAGRPA